MVAPGRLRAHRAEVGEEDELMRQTLILSCSSKRPANDLPGRAATQAQTKLMLLAQMNVICVQKVVRLARSHHSEAHCVDAKVPSGKRHF